MTTPSIHILHADGISAAGMTVPEAVEAFYAARQNISVPPHFNHKNLLAGAIPSLAPEPGESRAIALLKMICSRLPAIPEDTILFVATTVGAIDLLEQASPDAPAPDCTRILLDEARRLTGCRSATLVSTACSSGQNAVSMAARALSLGLCSHALVIGLDITSLFVTSGFSSLRAYAKSMPHPYDAERDGMILGEGVGALLLTSESCGQKAIGTILAAFESCDASHITAPDVTGISLARLITHTLQESGLTQDDIAGIVGHGTGTRFNDSSELAALASVFPTPKPLLSIKGLTGHTLGATGVLQVVYGLEFLKRGIMPPQAGLRVQDTIAAPFASTTPQPMSGSTLLSLNVGFGGLNSTLLFTGNTADIPYCIQTDPLPDLEVIATASINLETHTATYGDETIHFDNIAILKQILTERPGFPQADLADFRRAADSVRLAQLASILCAAATPAWSPAHTSIIGFNGTGCTSNNKAYWDDLVGHNYDNGRATLFVPTIPSIPVCEAAIALGIQGPVYYLFAETEEEMYYHILATFVGNRSIRRVMTEEITETTASVTLYSVR